MPAPFPGVCRVRPKSFHTGPRWSAQGQPFTVTPSARNAWTLLAWASQSICPSVTESFCETRFWPSGAQKWCQISNRVVGQVEPRARVTTLARLHDERDVREGAQISELIVREQHRPDPRAHQRVFSDVRERGEPVAVRQLVVPQRQGHQLRQSEYRATTFTPTLHSGDARCPGVTQSRSSSQVQK